MSAANYNVSQVELTTCAGGDDGNDVTDVGFKDLTESSPANIYVGKRNFIHQLMDVALMMANVSQLKSLLSLDTRDKYFIPLLVSICLSISLQVTFTLCMLFIWSIEKNLEKHSKEEPEQQHPSDKRRKRLADRLDKACNVLVLLVIVSNVFVTGLGVEAHGSDDGHVTTAAVVNGGHNQGNGSRQ